MFFLFLSNEDVHGRSAEIPTLTDFILKEALIRLLDVLRQVGIEHKAGDARLGKLRAVLDFDVLTFH